MDMRQMSGSLCGVDGGVEYESNDRLNNSAPVITAYWYLYTKFNICRSIVLKWVHNPPFSFFLFLTLSISTTLIKKYSFLWYFVYIYMYTYIFLISHFMNIWLSMTANIFWNIYLTYWNILIYLKHFLKLHSAILTMAKSFPVFYSMHNGLRYICCILCQTKITSSTRQQFTFQLVNC